MRVVQREGTEENGPASPPARLPALLSGGGGLLVSGFSEQHRGCTTISSCCGGATLAGLGGGAGSGRGPSYEGTASTRTL